VRRLRSLIGISSPTEARVFQSVAALALIAAIVYWFVSYETAGTVLLLGFAVASGIIGLLLANAGRDWRAAAGGRVDAERPFSDERGRLPTPTLAPFAVGIGASVALLSLIFGPAPLLVGALPLAWGAADWLRRARAEHDAQERAHHAVDPAAPLVRPGSAPR
jgi:hypothetical protein